MEKGPKKIDTLLSRYTTRFRPPQKTVLTTFTAIVERECGVVVAPEVVDYVVSKRMIVTTRLPGPVRSEVLLKKDTILSCCVECLGEAYAPTSIV